jgi:hypothetical protein
MRALDVDPLPICEGEQLVGTLTDRDITVRATMASLGDLAVYTGDAWQAGQTLELVSKAAKPQRCYDFQCQEW